MNQENNDQELPSFLPALILIGTFGLVLMLLLGNTSAGSFVQVTAPEPTLVVAALTELPPTVQAAADATQPLVVAVAQAAAYDSGMITQGQSIFQTACSTCHGYDARGIPGLGKNLLDSPFIHEMTDEALLQFIIVGRDSSHPLNTSGIPMPARGGNSSLTDAELNAVIAYLRTESSMAMPMVGAQPTAMPMTAAQVDPTTVPTAQITTTAPTQPPAMAQPFSAESAYNWSCAGCHGLDGNGNPPYGEGIQDSALLADREALMTFLIGQFAFVDPSVEYPHPVRGGYPILTDEQLSQLVEYLITAIEHQ